MRPARFLLLVATISVGLALIVKAAQVSLTPEFWAWLTVAADRLVASAGVGVLLVSTSILVLLSASAAAWDLAQRGDVPDAHGSEPEPLHLSHTDSSLMDDYNSILPIESKQDSGPKAA